MIKNFLRNNVVPLIDRIRARRIQKELISGKTPMEQLEKRIVMEIRGTLVGGMAASTEFMGFKESFYDKQPSEEEKKNIREILLAILNSKKYSVRIKALTAYICADIVIDEAVNAIEKNMPLAKKGSVEEKMFTDALEAFRARKSMSELIFQRLKERGDL